MCVIERLMMMTAARIYVCSMQVGWDGRCDVSVLKVAMLLLLPAYDYAWLMHVGRDGRCDALPVLKVAMVPLLAACNYACFAIWPCCCCGALV